MPGPNAILSRFSPPLLANVLETLTPVLLVAGLVLITAGMMMRLAKRRSGSTSSRRPGYDDDRLTAGERLERSQQQRGVRRDLESLMVEIEEMAKRLSHQLDAKALRLERLIDEADHRLTRMRHLVERLEKHGGDGPDSARAAEPPVDAEAVPSPPDPEPRSNSPDDLFASPGGEGAASDAAADPGPHPDPLARSVYALADEGLSALEIARRLEEHTGKVELILALRPSEG